MAKPGVVPRVVGWLGGAWKDFPGLMILVGLLVVGGVILVSLVPGSIFAILAVLGIVGGVALIFRVAYEIVRHYD